MKKVLVLGLGVVAFFTVVSLANAQFMVGDRVQATANLNVRLSPGGSYLGSHMAGDYGTITGGPVMATTTPTSTLYTWWNINYDTGVDGWSVGDYLSKVFTTGSSTPAIDCGDVNKDGAPDAVDLGLIINVAFRGQTYANYNTDVDGNGVTDVVDVTQEIDYVYRNGSAPTGCYSGEGSLVSSLAFIGATNGRVKSVADNIARITIESVGDAPAYLNSLVVVFGGSIQSTSSFVGGVSLIDQSGNIVGTPVSQPSFPCGPNADCKTVQFNFGSGQSGYAIAPGSSVQFTLRINSLLSPVDQPGVSQTLSFFLYGGNYTWFNGSGSLDYNSAIYDFSYAPGSYPVKTTLSASALPIGVTSGRAPAAVDDLGRINFTAGTQGTATLNRVRVSFQGTAINNPAFIGGVKLYDQDIGSSVGVLSYVNNCGSGSCYLDFGLGEGINGYWISPGTTKSFTLRINSLNIAPAQNGVAYTLYPILERSYVKYTDNNSGATNLIPASSSPLWINAVTYAQGTGGSNQAPVLNTFTGPSSLLLGQVGTWYMSGSDPEGYDLNYWLSFGNASQTASGMSGQTVSVQNSYNSPGVYSVGNHATDIYGVSSNYKWLSVSVSSSSGIGTSVPSNNPAPTYIVPTTPPPVVPRTTTYQCGDLDRDGSISTTDVLRMKSYWTGGVDVPTGVNADLNGDGVAADILDYLLLSNHVTKNGPAPTCGGSSSGGTRTVAPVGAAALSAMQMQLDAIRNQLISILQQL